MKYIAHNFTWITVFCIGLLIIISCDLLSNENTDKQKDQENIYTGVYTQGIEDSHFKPCSASGELWNFVEIQDTAFVKKTTRIGENPMFMKLKGRKSELGEYEGFFISYDREVKVEKILEVKSLEEKQCL